MKPIRILIADDHTIVRTGLATLLDSEDGLEVVGEAEDGAAVLRQATKTKPDVIVMDLMMPVMDGIAATAELHKRLPEAKVLVLTTFATSDGIVHALENGASGALLKSAPNDELVTAIRAIAHGETFVSREVQRLIAEDPPAPRLTDRQKTILESVTKGLSNRDIGKLLGLREDSVREHLSAVFAKLGAATRAEAVAIALRKHLLKI